MYMHLALYYNIIKTYCVYEGKSIFAGVSEFFCIAIYHERFCFLFVSVPCWEGSARRQASVVGTHFNLCVLFLCMLAPQFRAHAWGMWCAYSRAIVEGTTCLSCPNALREDFGFWSKPLSCRELKGCSSVA